MKAASRARSGRRWTLGTAGRGPIAAFAIGGAAAWWLVVPQSLLAEARAAPPAIPKEKTVERQVCRAIQLNTEDAWQSVIDYFPDEQILYAPSPTTVGPDLPARIATSIGRCRFSRTWPTSTRTIETRCRIEGVRFGRAVRRADPSRQVRGVEQRDGTASHPSTTG